MIQSDDVMIFNPTPPGRGKITISDVDVTAKVVESEFIKPSLLLGIGTFHLKMINPGGLLSGIYVGGEDVKFYADNTDQSTLQFWGKAEYPNDTITKEGQFLEIEGRHRSKDAGEAKICGSFTNTANSSILTTSIDLYVPSITHTNVQATTKTSTASYNYIQFLEMARSLAIDAGYDGYIEDDLDLHFFQENGPGTINNNDAIFSGDQGGNFRGIKNWGTDKFYEKNTVTVIGKDDAGLPIIYTTGSGARELVIINNSANTMAQVADISAAEYSRVNGIPPQATILSFGLKTVRPGDNIWVSLPRNKIHGQYKILQVKHIWGRATGWLTECTFEREIRGLHQVLADRARAEQGAQDVPNPNKLHYSYNFDFKDSSNIQTLTNLQVSGGLLTLTSGSTIGTMVGNTLTTTAAITAMELRYIGKDLGASIFEFSTDGGITWITMTKETIVTLVGSNKLKPRITLIANSINPAPELDSMAGLYS